MSTEKEPTPYDKTEIFNLEIAPLCDQIFDLCKANGIPAIMTFAPAFEQPAEADRPARWSIRSTIVNMVKERAPGEFAKIAYALKTNKSLCIEEDCPARMNAQELKDQLLNDPDNLRQFKEDFAQASPAAFRASLEAGKKMLLTMGEDPEKVEGFVQAMQELGNQSGLFPLPLHKSGFAQVSVAGATPEQAERALRLELEKLRQNGGEPEKIKRIEAVLTLLRDSQAQEIPPSKNQIPL
jgi:hypothetical protein